MSMYKLPDYNRTNGVTNLLFISYFGFISPHFAITFCEIARYLFYSCDSKLLHYNSVYILVHYAFYLSNFLYFIPLFAVIAVTILYRVHQT